MRARMRSAIGDGMLRQASRTSASFASAASARSFQWSDGSTMSGAYFASAAVKLALNSATCSGVQGWAGGVVSGIGRPGDYHRRLVVSGMPLGQFAVNAGHVRVLGRLAAG